MPKKRRVCSLACAVKFVSFRFIILAEGMGAWMPIWMHTVWCYKQDSIPLQFIYILAARNTLLCICALGRRLKKPGSANFTA